MTPAGLAVERSETLSRRSFRTTCGLRISYPETVQDSRNQESLRATLPGPCLSRWSGLFPSTGSQNRPEPNLSQILSDQGFHR